MALVRSQYNACFDWLISGHYSSIMPMGRLRGCKNKIKTKIKTKCYNKLLLFPENCSSFKRYETRNSLRMNPVTPGLNASIV